VWALAGGVAATMLVGMVAGLYPAGRAARLPPSQALSH
jgi:putative ABC transport system permease protein